MQERIDGPTGKPIPKGPLVLTFGEELVERCKAQGLKHVTDATHSSALLNRDGTVKIHVSWWGNFVILIPEGSENLRDTVAITLGDDLCRWAYVPTKPEDIPNAVTTAAAMWSDEVSTLDDVPESGPEKTYATGLGKLDDHGFRLVLPCFVPIIGPYGSGKSVFLRQLLVNLYLKHGWKCLITAFEEKVKPRYHRDFRRHFMVAERRKHGKEWQAGNWTEAEIALADAKIRQSTVFLRRKRGKMMSMERLLGLVEFAAKVHGIRVVGIDPFNEIDHVVPRHENKTDYVGRCIMELKQLADDYGLCMFVCAHPPKDSVEKRMKGTRLLTLFDGADSMHWGNKADAGFCVWRDKQHTLLHLAKSKDHETMGKAPQLFAMEHDAELNRFTVSQSGYEILGHDDERND